MKHWNNWLRALRTAAQQMFSIQAVKDGDTDCSAIIQLTLDLAGVGQKETKP